MGEERLARLFSITTFRLLKVMLSCIYAASLKARLVTSAELPAFWIAFLSEHGVAVTSRGLVV